MHVSSLVWILYGCSLDDKCVNLCFLCQTTDFDQMLLYCLVWNTLPNCQLNLETPNISDNNRVLKKLYVDWRSYLCSMALSCYSATRTTAPHPTGSCSGTEDSESGQIWPFKKLKHKMDQKIFHKMILFHDARDWGTMLDSMTPWAGLLDSKTPSLGAAVAPSSMSP